MGAKIGVTGLRELQKVLDGAAEEFAEQGRKVLSRGALNIKRDAQAKISGLEHAPHYPQSISYDVTWRGAVGTAEIGPDKDKPQGALGNILEYGTIKNAPFAHLGPALDYELPEFEKHVGDIPGQVLG